MGRKPNQLIFQHFHRGQKLEDASNRYQHTCKACGEVFPKGRIDSLQNHLVRKCPALTAQEQSHIVAQIYQFSPAKRDAKAKEKQSQAARQNPAPQQTFDGLNVLAEASRQVTQVERRGSQTFPTTTTAQDDNDPMSMAIDPALDVFPHSFPNTFDHELGTFAQTNGSDLDALVLLLADNAQASNAPDMNSNTIPPLPHLPNEQTEDESHTQTIHAHEEVGPRNPGSQDHDLPSIAADASELLPTHGDQSNGASHEIGGSSGLSGIRDDSGVDGISHGTLNGIDEHNMDVSAAGYEEHSHTDSHSVHGPPNATGQGNESLAAAVQDADKPGESWVNYDDGPHFQAFWEAMQRTDPKSPKAVASQAPNRKAIATRSQIGIGEFGEFSLETRPPPKFTRQKFSAERRREVQDVRKKGACLRCRMLRKPCSAETPCGTCRNIESARLWKEPCMRVRITELFNLYAVSLHSQLAHRQVQTIRSQPHQEESHGRIHFTHFNDSAVDVSVRAVDIHVDGSNIPELVPTADGDMSLRSIKLIESEGEDTVNMIASYLHSQGPILRDDEPSRIVKLTLSTLRELFEENKDPLLEDVLQLWTATHVLCDHQLIWNISYVSSTTQETTVIDETSDRPSYRLLACQLQAFVETHASQTCKKVLQSYEKKLMHNKRSFDMFLVAIVIVNCFERMEWLFHIWNSEEYSSEWPLERRPTEFFGQAEKFAEILHMVLKMRLVAPKVAPRPDTGVLLPADPAPSKELLKWYTSAQLTVEYLKERQTVDLVSSNSRAFDLRYASKILLPQNAYS